MMPAEGDGGTSSRPGRKSRANAGARLKDILQQEAKDLKTLEAEADQETEKTAQHATAGSKKSRQRQHSQQGSGQQQAAAAAAMNGVAHVKAEGTAAADEASDSEAAAEQAAAAVEAAPAAKGKAQKKAAAAAVAQDAAVAEATAAAPAAVVPAPAPAPAAARRTIKAPLQRLQRPVRGADEGEGAALGQALGAADGVCWSAIREPVATSKQPSQQQRGTKRKRSIKVSTPPPDATTETGTEDGEDVVASHVSMPAQPAGKPLPVGTRPSWLVQALQGGSAALNKRQFKGLPDDLSQPQQVEFMLGCMSCDYQQHGCAECRKHPEVSRPMARWQPDSGHPQVDLAEAAAFKPSKQEFADPFAYIAGIAEQFVKQGIAKIVPPAGCWTSPQYVQQLKAACSSSGSGGAADELLLSVQRQFPSHLCLQGTPSLAGSSGTAAASGAISHHRGPVLEQLLGPDVELLHTLDRQAEAGPAAAAAAAAESPPAAQQGGDVVMQYGADSAEQQAPVVAVKQEQQEQPGMQQLQQEPCMWRTHTLRSFAAYADWAKRMHFSAQPCNAELHAVLQPGGVGGAQRRSSTTGLPPAKRVKHDPDHHPQPSRDTGTEAEVTEDADADAAAESHRDAQQQQPAERHSSRLQAKGRVPLHPLKASAGSGGRGASPEPGAAKGKASKAANSTTSATPPTTPRTKAVKSGSRLAGAAATMLGLAAGHPDAVGIDQFEAEYWRIVEQRQPGRVVEVLTVPELRSSSGGSVLQELQELQDWGFDEQQQQQQQAGSEEAIAWDLSSLPARRENLLRYLPLQQAIPGLTEPVLGVSSCLSSCCWQVTHQGMYGISCLHSGAPRVWYVVPESANEAFQVAMQDCLPHLFAANPAVLQQAAVAVSPNELRARGVPVCRLVQEPGTFVVLLPNAYHCWFSTGLSIHESVAVAPWDCLGAGCDAERSCRQQHAPTVVSQTELLVTLVSSCRCVADAHGAGGGDIEAEADEQAAAVASAALAALSKARVHPSNKAAKQQAQQHLQQQDTHADEPDQRATAKHKQQKQQGAAKQQKQQKQQQRQKSPVARKRKSAATADSDGSNSDSDAGSSSDTDAGSVVSWAVSYGSSSDGSGSDVGSSDSSDGSDSEPEASQPCWGAAAGAQQLLEPGLAWASGACASAALELVPKPAILAAVGELVLRVEEEQCRQAAARQHGVKQEQRMHGAVLPRNHCAVCSADLWLSAVISSAAAGQAVCPQHAAALAAAADSCTLMFRHSIEELQRLLFEAAALFPGCADDIRAAQQRVRSRPVVRGLKSLGPIVQLSQAFPVPRLPELKAGGRDPATPVAEWVKQLMALAAARLPLVGNGAAARLPPRQRRAAVEEALQVAAAAFSAVQSSSSIDDVDMGQKLAVQPLRHKDEAVQLVVQQLLKQAPQKQAAAAAAAAAAPKANNAKGAAAGKGAKGKQQQQQEYNDSSSSEGESESEGEREPSPLQPRQRKLPGWLQAECVVDKAVAKRAKASAGAKGGKAGERSVGDAKAAAAAMAASFSVSEVLPWAEQALEAVAANTARQEKRRRRQERELLRQQQQQEQLQEQRRQQRQQEQRMANGVAAVTAAAPLSAPLSAHQLTALQQQQLLALQQQSQQLLLAAAPASLHRPPQARSSREQLRDGGTSGGRGKGRGGGKGAAGRGERRTSNSGSGGGARRGPAAVVATEQQQQLAAQLTLQQLQLQAQFRAAALAAAAAAAGQGTPAAATVPAGGAAAGAQLAQASTAGFVGFPGPLITMHNGVPVLIFAAPLPQQQAASAAAAAAAAAATAAVDPAAQAAAAAGAGAGAAPAEGGASAEVQQQQLHLAQAQAQLLAAQQLQLQQLAVQQQQQQADAAASGAAAAAAPTSQPGQDPAAAAAALAPAAAATAPQAAAPAVTDAAAVTAAAPSAGDAAVAVQAEAATLAAAPSTSAPQAAAMPAAPPVSAAPGAADAGAVPGALPAAAAAAAPAAAGSSQGQGQAATDLGAHSSGQLASSASMQHSSGQLTDAEAAAAAAHAEAEAVASKAAAEAVAAAAVEARLVAGMVGNGHHPAAPAASMPAPTAANGALTAAAATGAASAPMMLQQQSLPHAVPAAAAAAVPGPVAYQGWQQQQLGGQMAGPVSAAPAVHPVECMLQVEEFFHSQEPGHVDHPVAVPAHPELSAAVPAVAAAAAVPAVQVVDAPVAAVPEAAAEAPVPPAAEQAVPAAAETAASAPPKPAAATPVGGVDVDQEQAVAQVDEVGDPAAGRLAFEQQGAAEAAEAEHAAGQAAETTAAAVAAAAEAAPVALPAADVGISGQADAAAPMASPPLQPALPAAAAPSAPVAPLAAALAAGGGINPDDQMDELELEPLVDFGMDDFDW